jgi:hypothetical protein
MKEGENLLNANLERIQYYSHPYPTVFSYRLEVGEAVERHFHL